MKKAFLSATRGHLETDARSFIDHYFISLTNIQERLVREIGEGVLDPDALGFGGPGLFGLPYCRTSWSPYRSHLSGHINADHEIQYDLDPAVDVAV